MIRLRPSTIILTREEIAKALDAPRVSAATAADSPYSAVSLPWGRGITLRKHNHKGKAKAGGFDDEEDVELDASFRFPGAGQSAAEGGLDLSPNVIVNMAVNADDDEGYYAGTDDDHLEEEDSTNPGPVLIQEPQDETPSMNLMLNIHNDAFASPLPVSSRNRTPGFQVGDNILGPSTGNILAPPSFTHDGALADDILPLHPVTSPQRREDGEPIDIDYLTDIDFDGISESDQENTFLTSLTLPEQLDGESDDSYQLPVNRSPFPSSPNNPGNSSRYIRASPFSLPIVASPRSRRLFSPDFQSSDAVDPQVEEFHPPFMDHRHRLRHSRMESEESGGSEHFLRPRTRRREEAVEVSEVEVRSGRSTAPARSLR